MHQADLYLKCRTETDVPGAAYLLSISNFEASVSSYLVGAPSTGVSAVTGSNVGSEGVKSGISLPQRSKTKQS